MAQTIMKVIIVTLNSSIIRSRSNQVQSVLKSSTSSYILFTTGAFYVGLFEELSLCSFVLKLQTELNKRLDLIQNEASFVVFVSAIVSTY